MKNAILLQALSQATEGVAETLTDTLLFLIFLYGDSFGKRGSKGIFNAFEQADMDLTRVNYQQIKKALYNLSAKRLISRQNHESKQTLSITKAGIERFTELFPTYKSNRPWDEHVYLISYDILSKNNTKRNLLRQFIYKTGGAMLQESLWLNPYNPQKSIEQFVHQRMVEGSILISKIGHDGAIGTETLDELIFRIYHYDDLIKQYKDFIKRYASLSSIQTIPMTFEYHAILKDDPQLPFALEPKNFPAKQANELFKRYTSLNLL